MQASLSPSARSVLSVLAKPRLIALGRDLDVAVPGEVTRDAQVDVLIASGKFGFHELLRRLGREELKAVCRAHGLDASGRARAQLSARLLKARPGPDSAPPRTLFSANEVAYRLPRAGDIVLCRHREWLVEGVTPAREQQHATQVRLVCLDDDAQGRSLEVLWELELGARVHRPESHGLGSIDKIDPPRHFAAYLHALKWNSVTATDRRLFQSPFRAGIHLQAHQLTPLKKALSLPRANLFIADDVGLGKTIEAGLVLSELILRQRVELAIVICPASVCLQWRDEMAQRFGLSFEVMSREFVAHRRRERGFGVNPWSTHRRFIVSHQLIRRPEYRDTLLAVLGDKARKSLLILDEAHVAAPATARKYAVDSNVTRVMRDIAPRFENRLFLSATPHNGHSNSFSALLEILDPQRFTRGVPVTSQKQLEPVMVRRLKRDLRDAGLDSTSLRFPERRVVQFGLSHEAGHWKLSERTQHGDSEDFDTLPTRDLGLAAPFELRLAEDLERYTELAMPKKGTGKLVFINLQKRLLSSVEAFARTLNAHAIHQQKQTRAAAEQAQSKAPSERTLALPGDDDAYGADDDVLEAALEARMANATRALPAPSAEAKQLLTHMQEEVARQRHQPDAKLRALVDWIARNQCEGVRLRSGQSSRAPAKRSKSGKRSAPAAWNERRLILFTEYADTKRYLLQMLHAAVADTADGEARILQFHGGMGDAQREEVQRAFNGAPDAYPVRILVATDAAREGINLQGHCADLIHYDLPWNPGRLEQRNGRIDRTLQPSPEVRCGYFSYAQRSADPVLATLVRKVGTITEELGSLGNVVMDAVASDLDARGIDATSSARIDRAVREADQSAAKRELETPAAQARQKLKDEIEDASEILESSRRVLEFDSTLLRDALNVGFELSGADNLAGAGDTQGAEAFTLPELSPSWQRTLDALRPPRGREEPYWEWRKRPPRPVTFEPPSGMSSETVQLHLQHPLVQRVLGRFLAQGYSMNDLSRVTVLQNKRDALVRVIGFGRLSLFGSGATRLHDEVISVAARWVEGKPLKPFADQGDRKSIELLEETLQQAQNLDRIPKKVQQQVQAAAAGLFAELWKPIREEADARAVHATEKLKARGREEHDQLEQILRDQRAAIRRRLKNAEQTTLEFSKAEREEQKQFEADRKHMHQRLEKLDEELRREPAQVESLYHVSLQRLQPVGLIVLWPKVRS